MNTKTKLLYVGFRALNTCCLYAAFLMITSCGDNVVNPDSPEPDREDMIPVTVSRVEDGSYMESHVDTPDTTGGRTLVDEWVPVEEPPASRAIPAAVPYEGPSAVRMTLREEPQVTTRAATLGNGIYFRLIAFRKVRVPVGCGFYDERGFRSHTQARKSAHQSGNSPCDRILVQ